MIPYHRVEATTWDHKTGKAALSKKEAGGKARR
jgi:hypothetical protein